MPTVPEIIDVLCQKWVIEIFYYFESQQKGETDCDVRISRELTIQVETITQTFQICGEGSVSALHALNEPGQLYRNQVVA